MKPVKIKPVATSPIRMRENTLNALSWFNTGASKPNKENLPNQVPILNTAQSPNNSVFTRKFNTTKLAQPQSQFDQLKGICSPKNVLSKEGQLFSQKRGSLAKMQFNMATNKIKCVNHPEKEAEFRSIIDGQETDYCVKCSAHLASQGFTIQKISKIQSQRQSNIDSNSRNPPIATLASPHSSSKSSCSQLSSQPRYQQILCFLQSLKSTQQSFQQNLQSLSNMPCHFSNQHQLYSQFYDAIISYLQHLKQQHLKKLSCQTQKYTCFGELQITETKEMIEEIGLMMKDIQDNVAMIVRNVDQHRYRECIGYYQERLERYRQRVQEQHTVVEGVEGVSREQLEERLHQFREVVDRLFEVRENLYTQVEKKSNLTSSMAIPHIPSKPSIESHIRKAPQSDRPTTTINTFEFMDELQQLLDQQDLPDESPQFKKI